MLGNNSVGKVLAFQARDLTLIPRSKPRWYRFIISVLGNRDRWVSGAHWPASVGYVVNSRLVRELFSKTNNNRTGKGELPLWNDTWAWHLVSTFMPTHIHEHLHMNMHIHTHINTLKDTWHALLIPSIHTRSWPSPSLQMQERLHRLLACFWVWLQPRGQR